MPESLVAALVAGQTALEAGRMQEAIAAFRDAQRLAPSDVAVGLALANAQRLADDVVGARATLLDAHRQRPPADPALSYELGAALLDAGAPREAAACFLRVSRAHPTDPAPLAALAGAKRTLGEPDAAWAFIEQALSLAPDLPALLLTAAQIRHDLADLDGADAWLDRADAQRPEHGATQVQRAYTSLLRGASQRGWGYFESRPLPAPKTGARAWHGESLAGASIAVTAEQGVGDQFQFARFIPRLAARGAARVVVECHADAVSLFATSGFDAVPRGQAPPTDWHVPMMSLPYRLELDAMVDSDRVPYLRAPALTSADAVPARTRPSTRRLGLVWAGNPAFSGRVTRDLDPSLLPALIDAPAIEWVALQHGEAAAAADARVQRIPLATEWLATAAILASLDGLVTTDTGIAHLAGAMGLRTWVLLQHVPDWRWGLSGDTTAWYPTVRLVRQPSPGDWRGVIDALHCHLSEFAS